MMKFIFIVGLTIIISITACVNDNQSSKNDLNASQQVSEKKGEKSIYKKITPDEAKNMMVKGNLILDVRTPDEYNQGHIPGAMLLPVQDILNNKLDLLPNKDQIILVYCRSGNRSAHAARSLIREGYTNIYDFGGIIDWPYEIEK